MDDIRLQEISRRIDAAISSRAIPGDQMDLLAATIADIRKTVCLVGDPASSVGKLLFDYLNASVGSRAIPGDAMALTPAERLLVQALIINDVTPFAGANIAELAAANIPTDIDGLKTSRDRQLFCMDFWSIPQISVVVPAGALTQALPNVVVDILPAGMTIVKATPIFKFRMLSNAGAANKLTGDQHIQIQKNGAGGFADAISLVDDQFNIGAAAREGGDVVIGDHNVVAKVDAVATYNFQWTNAVADVAALTFNDVQCGLRIWYSV